MNARLHYPQIDSVRGLMAWWVVAGHLLNFFGLKVENTNNPLLKLMLATSIPVDIFICISGFVIFGAAARTSHQGFRSFLTQRFFRIYPVYILCILAAAMLLPLRTEVFTSLPWHSLADKTAYLQVQQSVQDNLGWHLLLHGSLMHGVVPDNLLPFSGSAILAPAWSLSLEWQFYLVAPLLFMCANRRPAWFIAIALGMVLFKGWAGIQGLKFSYGAFLPIKFEMFLLGMLTYQLLATDAHNRKKIFFLSGVILVLSGALLSQYAKLAAVALLLWLALMLLITQRNRMGLLRWLNNTVLSHPLLVNLGLYSYSTYLIHVLIIDLVGHSYKLAGIDLTVAPLHIAIFSAITAMIVLFLSRIIYSALENPLNNFGKKVAKQWQPTS